MLYKISKKTAGIGIVVTNSFTVVIFGYFLPGDTEETVNNTRKMVWELNSMFSTYVEAQYLNYSTDPGSPAYREPERYGVELKINNLEEHMKYGLKFASNILIHTIKTIEPMRQIELYNIIAFDAILQILFREISFLLVRSFNSINDFIIFIDRFYDIYLKSNTAHNCLSQSCNNNLEILERLYSFY